MKTMKWLLKREFWENKGGFFWAPLIGGGVFLAINIMIMLAATAAADRAHLHIGAIKIGELMKHADPAAMEAIGTGVDISMVTTAGMIMMITAVVVFFYSLGTLFDERRDRSILFWKSLPVSDRETVVSKVLSAAVVAPVIGFAAGLATALLQHLLIGVFMLFHGQNVFGLLFGSAHPIRITAVLLSMLPIYALWALPTIGWLMLVSVWAKSKPFLWGVLLPLGAGVIVSWFDLMRAVALPETWFWKHIVARLLLSIVPGGWLDFERFENLQIRGPEAIPELFSPSFMYGVLAGPNIWIGAAAGIAMLILAVRLRRWRDDA